MLHHPQQAWIAAKQVLAKICAALYEEFLILAVGDFAQASDQQAVAIVLDEAVPIAAPDDFDYVPSRATEDSFKFLNDFAVAANWPIQALEVAVDYPDQIVESLAGGERN